MQTKIWILLSDGVGSMFCLNSLVSSVGSHSIAGALVFHCILLHLYFGKSQILICLGKSFGGNHQPYNRHTLFFPHGSYGEMLSQLQNYLQFQILSCKNSKLHERTTFSTGYSQEVRWNNMNEPHGLQMAATVGSWDLWEQCSTISRGLLLLLSLAQELWGCTGKGLLLTLRRGCIIFPCACQYWAALKDSASAVLLSSEVNTEYF